MLADRGTPIVATLAGFAEFKNTGAGGKSVWLTTADGDKFFYAHLDEWEGESRDVDLGEGTKEDRHVRFAKPEHRVQVVDDTVFGRIAGESELRGHHLAVLLLDAARAGLKRRFELLRERPPLIIDGAHNPQAAEMLATSIEEVFADVPPMVVLAILADKDAEGIVRALAPVASGFVVSENGSPRCLAASELAVIVECVTGIVPVVEPDLERAVAVASEPGCGVIVTGSLYTAGAVRALFV